VRTKITDLIEVLKIVLAASFALMIVLSSRPASCSQGFDPKADTLLKSMSVFLSGLSAFSVNADVDNEIVTIDGQKIQLSASGTIVIKRPDHFNITRQGMFADVEFVYDGKSLILSEKRSKLFYKMEGGSTIDDAFFAYEYETGLTAPAADLLMSNPYEILVQEVVNGTYMGIAYINGVSCHHLVFRQDRVDWQIWIQTDTKPFPIKFVITDKWISGSPQYSIRFKDWNTDPAIAPDQFEFKVPEGARELETLPVNEFGEIELSKGGK
jgi:hypothetical protein